MQRWNLSDWARMGKSLGLNSGAHCADVNEPARGTAVPEKGGRRSNNKRRTKKRE